MNDIDATDALLTDVTEMPEPALRLLAAIIDREFQRREPEHPTPYEYAAAKLGTTVPDLVILAEDIEPAIAHSVGRWLFEAQGRYGADHAGGSTRPCGTRPTT